MNELGRWLAARSETEALWMLLVPGILGASYVGNKWGDTRTDEERAKLLMISGLVVLGVGGGMQLACGARKGGVCSMVR